jgi:hypothetical protein
MAAVPSQRRMSFRWIDSLDSSDMRGVNPPFKYPQGAPMVRCFFRISAGIKKDATPIQIGPVGGRIVAETFVGLVVRDGHSFLAADSDWAPNKERKFLMSDLIKKGIAL